MPEHYITAGGKRLRCGRTTGTCAAMAAAGAVRLLLTGRAPDLISLNTPRDWMVEAPLLDCVADGETAACSVEKDGGDDVDATHGLPIRATVRRRAEGGTAILGGPGVGRVTRPGLDQPVGEAAINSVPRRMIARAAEEEAAALGYAGGLEITISVPGGEEAARRTFNPQLGVEGGISILGTSGIVRPMSEAALLDSLYLEMDQQKAAGARDIVVTPGNYGEAFAREKLGLSLARWCTCSNYIGAAIDHAAGAGFRSVLLVGHLGKLIKVSAGCMNTHSKVADARRETLAAHAALAGGDRALVKALFDSPTTDAGVELLRGAGLLEPVMDSIAGELDAQLKRRAGPELAIEGIFFSNQYGILGKTPGAEGLLALHRA